MKKNNLLKLSLLALALSSCDGGEGTGGRRILKFEFLKAGFGTEVYQALADAYMETHKDVLVKLIPNKDINTTTASKLEANNNLADLYSVRSILSIDQWAIKGWVKDLTEDVYTDVIEKDKTLLDLLDSEAADYSQHKGRYYSVPEYVNVNGWVYNASLFKSHGWTVPRNTAELSDLCEKIIADTHGEVAPIIYCGAAADGYLYLATDSWMTTYTGVSDLDKFYDYPSPEVFEPSSPVSIGKSLGMTNLKKFFGDKYVMEGSASKTHIVAQTNLIQGKAAMMVNGSWFENEMKATLSKYNDLDFQMFPCPAVSDEEGNLLHSESYTTEDNKTVLDTGVGASYFIPKNAKNTEDAVDFLKFLNTSFASELYTSKCNAIRPLKYNKDSSSSAYLKMSNFGKSVMDIAKNNKLYIPRTHNSIALRGYLSLFPQGGYWNYKILNDPTTFTNEYCLNSDYQYVLNNWDYWKTL